MVLYAAALVSYVLFRNSTALIQYDSLALLLFLQLATMKSDPSSTARRRRHRLAQLTAAHNEWNAMLLIAGILSVLAVAPSPCFTWFFTSALHPGSTGRSRRATTTSVVASGKVRSDLAGFSASSLAAITHDAVTSNPNNDNGVLPRFRVGIAGAGAIALGTAALLVQWSTNNNNQHNPEDQPPMIWSPSRSRAGGTIRVDRVELITRGALEQTCTICMATSAQELVDSNDIILVALPANGHKMVLDQLAPYIRPGQPVIFSSHASMGALYLASLLRARGVQAPLTAWGTTVVTARREQLARVEHHRTHDAAAAEEVKNEKDNQGCGSYDMPFAVRINTVRKAVDGCTVPVAETESSGLGLCRELFPGIDFRQREGLLAISLSNLNPQNHLAMALCNLSRIEKGEAWHQSLCVTPKVGKFMEALDAERLAIASALGLSVRTIFEHFHLSFHVQIRDNMSEMCQDIYNQGRDVLGPATASSRYITEDAPFGLALTVVLGRLVGRPAVLHQSGLAILSAMYERDFYNENDLLEALDLENVDLDLLKEASLTGRLESHQRSLV